MINVTFKFYSPEKNHLVEEVYLVPAVPSIGNVVTIQDGWKYTKDADSISGKVTEVRFEIGEYEGRVIVTLDQLQ